MTQLLNWLRDVFSAKLVYEKKSKTSLLIIDPRTFKENEVKEMSVWCWRCVKCVKAVVECKNGKFFVEYIGCPHMKGSS